MFLSIIVPMYNVEKYIDKCIWSLTNQDIADYEILIIDDSSTDDSLKKALHWERETSTVRVIKKASNSGLSDTRNIGLHKAKGNYILFVDSDDYIDANALGKLCQTLVTYEPDILYFGYVVETKDKSSVIYNFKTEKEKAYNSHDFMARELKARNLPIPACAACYKKSLIIDNDLFFETGLLHEDVRWSPEVLYSARSVYTSSMCFYHYMLRTDSISQKKDRTKNGRDLVATCAYLEQFIKRINNNDLQKIFFNYVAMTYMKAVAVNDMTHDKNALISRSFPIKHVDNLMDFGKALLFFISPFLYSKVYMFVKIKIKKDIL